MSLKNMSKANARQSMKNKPRYDRYRSTATREKNQMRRLMRHLKSNGYAWNIGEPSYLISVAREKDPQQTIAKAWEACVGLTGAGYARELIKEYKN